MKYNRIGGIKIKGIIVVASGSLHGENEVWYDYGAQQWAIGNPESKDYEINWTVTDLDGNGIDAFVAGDFDLFYLDIPTPFKHGDILAYSGNASCGDDVCIFVLDYLDRDDEERLERRLCGKMGDIYIIAENLLSTFAEILFL